MEIDKWFTERNRSSKMSIEPEIQKQPDGNDLASARLVEDCYMAAGICVMPAARSSISYLSLENLEWGILQVYDNVSSEHLPISDNKN